MPVYQLLGGKGREGAAVYAHADGREPREVAENVRRFMDEGYRFVRVQMGGYGGKAGRMVKPEGAPSGAYYDRRAYMRAMLGMMQEVRAAAGGDTPHPTLSPASSGPGRLDLHLGSLDMVMNNRVARMPGCARNAVSRFL